ncbi:hypothetical protein PR202_ga31498 [Eleusine coracana subsp. coracana]|uniref:Uncharacterized protein n=1 Tax=Eleusine coracana subsp. coracana TaxID=191504 RepID=A0AAV5DRK7_ELECO|nr:hypothetical protein PR202_ga31498 [Eleusine coracana subsp. coracana]
MVRRGNAQLAEGRGGEGKGAGTTDLAHVVLVDGEAREPVTSALLAAAGFSLVTPRMWQAMAIYNEIPTRSRTGSSGSGAPPPRSASSRKAAAQAQCCAMLAPACLP